MTLISSVQTCRGAYVYDNKILLHPLSQQYHLTLWWLLPYKLYQPVCSSPIAVNLAPYSKYGEGCEGSFCHHYSGWDVHHTGPHQIKHICSWNIYDYLSQMTLHQVSGPTSYTRYLIGSNAVPLLVFGDEHYSKANMCAPCESSNCDHIVNLLERKLSGTQKQMDFFLEINFATGQSNAPLFKLRTEFGECLGTDKDTVCNRKYPRVRFHYADPRWDAGRLMSLMYASIIHMGQAAGVQEAKVQEAKVQAGTSRAKYAAVPGMLYAAYHAYAFGKSLTKAQSDASLTKAHSKVLKALPSRHARKMSSTIKEALKVAGGLTAAWGGVKAVETIMDYPISSVWGNRTNAPLEAQLPGVVRLLDVYVLSDNFLQDIGKELVGTSSFMSAYNNQIQYIMPKDQMKAVLEPMVSREPQGATYHKIRKQVRVLPSYLQTSIVKI